MGKKSLSDEIVEQKKRNVLLILTGPSGSGKDTVITELIKRDPQIKRIITTTSRQMRDGEREGAP